MGFASTAPCEMSEKRTNNVMSAGVVESKLRGRAFTEASADKNGRRVREALNGMSGQSWLNAGCATESMFAPSRHPGAPVVTGIAMNVGRVSFDANPFGICFAAKLSPAQDARPATAM
jgi:hypothetical protein